MDAGDLFVLLAQLGERMDAAPLNRHAGCWEVAIDSRWWIAVNPHREPLVCAKGMKVPPFHCFVEYNGWPAGLFTPHEGWIADGAGANIESFAAALQAKIATS